MSIENSMAVGGPNTASSRDIQPAIAGFIFAAHADSVTVAAQLYLWKFVGAGSESGESHSLSRTSRRKSSY